MPLSGHCLCKAVTYKVDIDAPLLTGYDHCDDCQRQSGSTYCKIIPSLFLRHCPDLRRYPASDLAPTPPPFRSYQIANKFDVTALVVVVPKDKLEVNGPVKKWKGTADSGNAVWRWFCEECGSPIAHDPDAAPEIIALKGGSLDTKLKKDLKPVSY